MKHPATTLAVALCLSACDMFDPALYQRAESLTTVADSCAARDVPVLGLSTRFVMVELDTLSDDWRLDTCGQGQAVGNDGFLAVDLEGGRKLHVHVNAIDPIDPVVYVVAGCDERNCQALNAATACPTGKEHLSFIPPRDGRYFIGIDGAEPGGGLVEVLALAPTCGDGTTDHSEACEDGNTVAGDGCDGYCRNELSGGPLQELEANDDLASGNVVPIGSTTTEVAIRGTAEGPCDPDVFSFNVKQPRTATIALRDTGKRSCQVLGAQSAVTLTLYHGLSQVAEARAAAGEPCPSLPATALQPAFAGEDVPVGNPAADGSYHVQVAVESDLFGAPIEYELSLSLGGTTDSAPADVSAAPAQ